MLRKRIWSRLENGKCKALENNSCQCNRTQKEEQSNQSFLLPYLNFCQSFINSQSLITFWKRFHEVDRESSIALSHSFQVDRVKSIEFWSRSRSNVDRELRSKSWTSGLTSHQVHWQTWYLLSKDWLQKFLPRLTWWYKAVRAASSQNVVFSRGCVTKKYFPAQNCTLGFRKRLSFFHDFHFLKSIFQKVQLSWEKGIFLQNPVD